MQARNGVSSKIPLASSNYRLKSVEDPGLRLLTEPQGILWIFRLGTLRADNPGTPDVFLRRGNQRDVQDRIFGQVQAASAQKTVPADALRGRQGLKGDALRVRPAKFNGHSQMHTDFAPPFLATTLQAICDGRQQSIKIHGLLKIGHGAERPAKLLGFGACLSADHEDWYQLC